MKLQDIILNRRSTRKYLSENIPEETLREILTAGLLAPTSRNRKPCEFYVVRDRKILSVPDNYRIAGILSLGIPAEKMKEHSLEEADWEKVRWG